MLVLTGESVIDDGRLTCPFCVLCIQLQFDRTARVYVGNLQIFTSNIANIGATIANIGATTANIANIGVNF